MKNNWTTASMYRQLDVLINNADVVAPNIRQETIDGFELQYDTTIWGILC